MIKELTAITPEYLKQRLEEQEECYKQEIERLNNIIEDFEEELEREVNIKEEDTGLEHNTYIDINTTLKSVLKRFRKLKGEDKTFNERVEEIYNSHMKYIYDKEDKKIEKITNMNCIYSIDNNCYEKYSNKAIALDINTLRHWINKIIDYLRENK